MILLACAVLGIISSFSPAAAQSVAVEAGYRDFYYGTVGVAEPTSEKPQSKLWWNDGLWWGCLWNPTTNGAKFIVLISPPRAAEHNDAR